MYVYVIVNIISVWQIKKKKKVVFCGSVKAGPLVTKNFPLLHLFLSAAMMNIGTQGVQELFFVNWKVSEIAELNQWHLKCFIKQTTVIWQSPN